MTYNLRDVAGFNLSFDPYTFGVDANPDRAFEIKRRRAAEMRDVLLYPDSITPETELYQTQTLVRAPSHELDALNSLDLVLGLVLIPSLLVGGEYVKTQGHFHPPLPGTTYTFPEVYTQYSGRLLLYLQKNSQEYPSQAEECLYVEMTPGFVITIPPGYAHVMINPFDEPALMAGLYGRRFQPDYKIIKSTRGLAYYLVEGEKGPETLPNQNYQIHPPLQRLVSLESTPFEPIHPGRPVWESFLSDPQAYAFLTQPEAVVQKFGCTSL